ncbi:hypothetical protein EX30DRAFT_263782 [Ascodesmis nigricans]|uniref:MFS general substrate transporter n=1 Tax=Ascodesmis nigricans TaxID=341454 RepID=A0A4S2MXY3_9PEZI|nr:hypothetical protein EX30DRAFT_263782 [Ascodesmis nigricans]
MSSRSLGQCGAIAKLANSHSRPLTFFLSSLQCIFGLALMVIGQLDDGSFPAGVGFQALGQCGILLIATIITMDTTTALSRGYFLWILSCSSPLWRLLAPALSSPITGLDPRHGWRWVVSVFIVLFTLLVTFINTLLFIFLHRAEEQGFFPPSHQQYQWTPSSIRDLWKNYVMFTAAYDTWGVLLLAISIICVVLGIAFTPPFQQHTSFFTLTPEQQLSMWRWGMVTVGFIGLALFVAWELLISPEFHILDLLHRLLPQKRSSPVIEKPLGTIHVLNTSADALENASATAARYASIIREKKMGRFWHNCKAVISPTLFKTNGALVYLTLGFMTAMLRTLVGQGRAQVEVFWNEHLLSPEMGKWTTLLPIVSIFTETTASLIVVAIIPFYRRLRFIIVLGFALISISTLLLIAPTAPLLTPKHETEHQFITHFLLSSGLGMVEIPLLVSTQTTLSKTRSDATIMTGLLYTVKSFAELLGTTVLENGEWVKEIEKQRVNRRMSELENVKVRAWIQKDERMGASDKFDDFITRPAPNFSDDKINFSEILHPPHPVRWDDFEPLIRFISHLMAIISLVLAITFVSNEDISKPARHSNTDPDNDGIILGIWLAPDEQEAEELVWTEDKHSDGEDWEVIKFDGYNDSEEDED